MSNSYDRTDTIDGGMSNEIEEAIMRQLKASQSSYKGKFTLASKQVDDALNSNEPHTVVLRRLDLATRAFERFKGAQALYITKLNNEDAVIDERNVLEECEAELKSLSDRVEEGLRNVLPLPSPRNMPPAPQPSPRTMPPVPHTPPRNTISTPRISSRHIPTDRHETATGRNVDEIPIVPLAPGSGDDVIFADDVRDNVSCASGASSTSSSRIRSLRMEQMRRKMERKRKIENLRRELDDEIALQEFQEELDREELLEEGAPQLLDQIPHGQSVLPNQRNESLAVAGRLSQLQDHGSSNNREVLSRGAILNSYRDVNQNRPCGNDISITHTLSTSNQRSQQSDVGGNPMLQQRHDIAVRPRYPQKETFGVLSNDSRAPEATAWRSSEVPLTNAVTDLVHKLTLMQDLPKVEIPKFSGAEGSDYALFMHYFDTYVDGRPIDADMKLGFLIEYCTDEARMAIKHLALKEDGSGYAMARSILETRFGRPHALSHDKIDAIVNGPPIPPGDGKGLLALATDMTACEMTIARLKFSSNIHSSENLLKIMWRLPEDLQKRWSSTAENVIRSGREPNFTDMTKFIESAGHAATNFFGKNIRSNRASNRRHVFSLSSTEPTDPTVLTTTNRTRCLYCNEGHEVTTCSVFKSITATQRRLFMRDHNRCFNCFEIGHFARGCMQDQLCTHVNCRIKHHTLLHVNITYPPNNQASVPYRPAASSNPSVNLGSACQRVFLRILPVKLCANGKEVFTNALLDDGSQLTLCKGSILTQLGYDGSGDKINVTTINGSSQVYNEQSVAIRVSSIEDTHNFVDAARVCAVDSLPNLEDARIKSYDKLTSWPHLANIKFPVPHSESVGLLIGSNIPEAFYTYEQTPFKRGEPYASKTILGWSLLGGYKRSNVAPAVNICIADNTLQQRLERLWNTDFPYECEDYTAMSQDDKDALQSLECGKTVVGDHYCLPLPLRCDPNSLICNWPLAKIRLGQLKKRLEKDSDLRKRYTEVVEGYISQGHAVETNFRPGDRSIYYLPHHAVVHPKKDKVRVVYDCAARWKGIALNDILHAGPDLNNNIVGVLLRFRMNKIALAADIEAMFHQVKVNEEHQKYLSFLWWPKGNLNEEPVVYQMRVHLFGSRSSPFCASFALRQIGKEYSQSISAMCRQSIGSNFYVDDFLISVEDKQAAISLREEMCDVLKKRGFNLTKWVTNDRNVLESIPVNMRASTVSTINLDKDELPSSSTLGLQWNVEQDSIVVTSSKSSKPLTRRGILSIVSSVYDPLGFVAPFCLTAKLLVQDLCKRRYDWDDDIDMKDETTWMNWLEDLSNLHALHIDRCIFNRLSHEINYCELHHFCDASAVAYSAVSYLRIQMTTGEVRCCFLIGRSRLAPIKAITIPRLELTAAVLSTKLHNIICQEMKLNVDTVTFWSDSSIVLQYIANRTSRFKIFVANRLKKILDVSTPQQWRHVDGQLNPADEATRGGVGSCQMMKEGRWIHGPKFLYMSKEQWPNKTFTKAADNEFEICKEERIVGCNTCENRPLDQMIQHFSKLPSLLKAASWMVVYRSYLRKMPHPSSLSTEHINKVMLSLICYTQSKHLGIVMEKIRIGGGGLPRHMQKLSPFFSEGILRVGGRLSNAPVPFDAKHPIILPPCHFTDLVIQHAHDTHGHVGPHHTWTILRENYWIVRGGVQVRRILGRCLRCKRRNTPQSSQFMADLPPCRTTPGHPPFHTTGVDFFGPILVKRARSMIKMYGCIFTCMASRAVHLEMADSLNTTAFINAMRRFIGRRGTPDTIMCDNGTNFIGAKSSMDRSLTEWNKSEWSSYLIQNGINWVFNPPTASHMGGAWERLVRSVKQILNSMLQSQTLSGDVLHTILVEVEAILNSRPLIPISLDPRDGAPLTPNHLLRLNATENLPPGIFKDCDMYSKNRWRQVQYLTDQFWSRWTKQYLPLLISRQKWTKNKRNVHVDDVVLVVDDRYPRRAWPLGRVVQVFPDRNGLVRQVDVKFRDSIHRRPVTKLCVLDDVATGK